MYIASMWGGPDQKAKMVCVLCVCVCLHVCISMGMRKITDLTRGGVTEAPWNFQDMQRPTAVSHC